MPLNPVNPIEFYAVTSLALYSALTHYFVIKRVNTRLPLKYYHGSSFLIRKWKVVKGLGNVGIMIFRVAGSRSVNPGSSLARHGKSARVNDAAYGARATDLLSLISRAHYRAVIWCLPIEFHLKLRVRYSDVTQRLRGIVGSS